MHSFLKVIGFKVLLAGSLLLPGCRQNNELPVDLPDVKGIYSDIKYLDSLLQSSQVDSITIALAGIENILGSYAQKNQTPDERAILDSMNRIKIFSSAFLRFCVDSRSNIELLNQDVASTEIQYKSGKVKSDYFINALVESEQTLVDINNRFLTDRARVLDALRRSNILHSMLTSPPADQPF